MSAGPVPKPIPETKEFWEGTLRGELRIPRCSACDRLFFYPRAYCPFCSSDAIVWETASGDATLTSYVINHRPFPDFESSEPQIIALVMLAEGVRMMTNLRDVEPNPEALSLGMPLAVRFEPRGDQALPMFVPKEVK